eukprot:TRINITY_DN1130_c0_g1_i1.p1 TRINITY_DN1130_c0_g1~~TRINITY_DN1130_c0_g1_i1.p1  ORF type:complete len:218 (+),score=27.05 TRINITY_DN1130_c0_g1_i1:39-692(+)
MLTRFLARYCDVVREGHSVFGMLPGFYDGWLLDNEGIIKDPFNRTERTLALVMKATSDILLAYWGNIACKSEFNLRLKSAMWIRVAFVWDFVVTTAVVHTLSHLVGYAKCKQELQSDNNLQNNKSKRMQSRKASIWAGFVTTVSAAFVYFRRDDAVMQGVLRDWYPSFLKGAFINEPLMMLGTLLLSCGIRRPVGGISYAKVDRCNGLTDDKDVCKT